MKATKKILASAVFGASVVVSGVAQADLMELWFNEEAEFDAPLVEFNDQGGALTLGAFTPGNAGFSWTGNGAGSGTSSIEISTFSTSATGLMLQGDLATDDEDGQWNQGDWWQISNLTQTNNVISIFGASFPDPLWIADAIGSLSIFDQSDLSMASVFDDTSVDRISFEETNNGACAAGEAPLGTQCDDIYGVAATSFTPVNFELDGYAVEVTFQLLPGPSSSGPSSLICSQLNIADPACNSLSAALTSRIVDDGELLVFTPETAPGTSGIDIFASWNATKIPVPATLGLLGMGLLGLGMRSRKS